MDEKIENGVDVERREFVRLTQESILLCEAYSIPASGEEVEHISKNISANGILFESNFKYDIDTVLRLKINLPGWSKFKPEFYKPDQVTESEPLVVLGCVVRIEKLSSEKYDIGVSLKGIDDGHKMALLKLIESKLKKANK